jgi:hypothetical protein
VVVGPAGEGLLVVVVQDFADGFPEEQVHSSMVEM